MFFIVNERERLLTLNFRFETIFFEFCDCKKDLKS